MKRSKIFMATATLVLAISAVFATKAHKKFNVNLKTGYDASGDYIFQLAAASNQNLFTTKSASTPEFGIKLLTGSGLRTVAHGSSSLITVSGQGHTIYDVN
jgi:hypothetical protein